ncbi:uncharacterized protein LOC117654186 isoform X1 [Thrips palmi]|uniref:Uncharacterized protein LOC117654186 isoform X1 n=1 Tax=Thrips palmi TaxID=161013 RepID=A0A6P9ALB9_THRPL|nr:uncharacterized protein LOC117654186 isoform X1 [Thrips palmi]
MDERACGQWPENHAKGIFFPCKVIKKGIGCWQGKSTRPASHRRGLASNPKAIPARILSNPSSGLLKPTEELGEITHSTNQWSIELQARAIFVLNKGRTVVL